MVTVVVALSSVIVPMAAEAQGCARTHLVIVTRTGPTNPVADGSPGFSFNLLYCGDLDNLPTRDTDPDTRIIPPGTTDIQVHWYTDNNPGLVSLSGLLTTKGIKMTRVVPVNKDLIGIFWSTTWIPVDPTLRGALTAKANGESIRVPHPSLGGVYVEPRLGRDAFNQHRVALADADAERDKAAA